MQDWSGVVILDSSKSYGKRPIMAVIAHDLALNFAGRSATTSGSACSPAEGGHDRVVA